METGNVKKDIRLVRKRLVQKEESIRSGSVWGMTALCFASTASLCALFLKGFSIEAGWSVYLGILSYCVLFTGYYEKKQWKKYRIAVIFGTLLFFCVLLFITQQAFLDSMQCVWNHIARQINQTYQGKLSETAGGHGTGMYFLLIVLFWITWFLAKGIIDRQDRGYFLMTAVPVVLFVLLSGGEISKTVLFVATLCFLCNISMSSVRKRSVFWGGEDSDEFRKNQNTGRNIQRWIIGCSALAGAVLLGVAGYGGQKVMRVPVAKLSEVSAPVKAKGMQVLYDVLPKISGGKLNLSLEGTGGGVSDGKLGDIEGSSYDGIEAVKVTSSVRTSEILYLKGFIGSSYTGDSWKAGDAEAFENAALNWKTEGDASLYVQNLPFLRMLYAQNTLKESGTDPDTDQEADAAELTVDRLNANTRYTYVPYQAYLNDYYQINGGDGAVAGQTAQDDSYAWYPQSRYQDVMKEWNGQEEDHSALDDLEASYEVYVRNHYEKVPDDMTKLKKLCHNKKKEWNKKIQDDMTNEQLKDLEQEKITDVRQFVVRTLWEHCTFTGTEKKLPQGEDYVEYFLFHEKKGDSTAFASAAAMMFRECGIPARYVVGYAAPSNLFTETSDGNYMAVLQDDNAHAWAEIYIAGLGWTPVETTPGFAGTVENMQMDEQKSDTQKQAEQKKDRESAGKKLQDGTRQVLHKAGAWVHARTAGMVIVVIMILAVLELRRRIIKAGRRGMLGDLSENEKVRKIFISFYEVLKTDAFPEDIDTMEETFIETLAERYPVASMEEWKKMMQIVLEANYGYTVLRETQTEVVRASYERLVKEVIAKMPMRKKMICIVWKAF